MGFQYMQWGHVPSNGPVEVIEVDTIEQRVRHTLGEESIDTSQFVLKISRINAPAK